MAYPLSISHSSTTEDAPAPYMRVTATLTWELIRNRLVLLTSIPSAARAVLIEVCSIFELGGEGRCYKSNDSLAKKACCHPKSVSRHLQTLEKAGLVSFHYPSKNKASREIVPAQKVLDIARGEDPKNLNESLVAVEWNDPKSKARLADRMERSVEGDGAYCGEGMERSVDSSPRSAPQVEYNREVNNSLSTAPSNFVAADAALREALQKIEKLEVRLEKAKECWRADQELITNLKAQLAAKPKAVRSKKAGRTCDDLKDPVEDGSLSFEKFWELYKPFRGEGKFAAKSIWITLDADLRRRLLDGLPNWISRKRSESTNAQFHPHASTFLNSNALEDECFAEALGVVAVPSVVPMKQSEDAYRYEINEEAQARKAAEWAATLTRLENYGTPPPSTHE